MKLKDLLYLLIIAVLVIKILTTKKPEQQPYINYKDSVAKYQKDIARLEVLLQENQRVKDSISQERNKIKIKYQTKYEKYRIKDSFANSLSVDSIKNFWTKIYHNN